MEEDGEYRMQEKHSDALVLAGYLDQPYAQLHDKVRSTWTSTKREAWRRKKDEG